LTSGHGHRREQKGVTVTVGRNSLADDDAGIADRSRDFEDAEVARGKIAKRVQIEHLAIRVKEGVLGVVARGGGTDNHAGGVAALGGEAVGRAHISAKRPQIGDGVAELRLDASKTDEDEENCGKTDVAFRFHSDGPDLPHRSPCKL